MYNIIMYNIPHIKDLYVESKIYNQLVNKTEKKQTHRYREQTCGYQWGQGRMRVKIGVGD